MSDNAALIELCKSVRSTWPSRVGSENTWHIALISSLITCHKLDELYEVLLHIMRSKSVQQPKQHQDFVIRVKDALMKLSQLVGIPLVVMALSKLVKAEDTLGTPVLSREQQTAHSRYQDIEATKQLDERGEAHMRTLYRSNLDPIMETWKSHQVDFEWVQKRVIYGLFLSDHEILDVVETEVLILSSIMCQELESPTMWHIRGLRRLGVNIDDAETVCDVVKRIAVFAGKDPSSWLKAKQVDTSG